MADPDDDRPLSAEAKLLMRYARIADLRSDADELAELVATLDEQLPRIPDVSMLQLYGLLARERKRRRRQFELQSRH